jgi:hypothetical protein
MSWIWIKKARGYDLPECVVIAAVVVLLVIVAIRLL